MTVVHELCGYNRTTELIAVEYEIPAELLPVVRTMIQPVADDRDLILAYEIAPENARRLGAMPGVTVDVDSLNFSIEASAVPELVAPAAGKATATVN